MLPNTVATWHHWGEADQGTINKEEVISSWLSREPYSPWDRLEHLAQLYKAVSEPEISTIAQADEETGQTWFFWRPSWRPQMESASTNAEIIAILRLFDLEAIANRLAYLQHLVEDDPEDCSINIESLRSFACFLMSERQLTDPQIGVTANGLIQIEWVFRTNGILAMEFLPSRMIRFAGISDSNEAGSERPHVNGTLPADQALVAVQPFISMLEPR